MSVDGDKRGHVDSECQSHLGIIEVRWLYGGWIQEFVTDGKAIAGGGEHRFAWLDMIALLTALGQWLQVLHGGASLVLGQGGADCGPAIIAPGQQKDAGRAQLVQEPVAE
jgi:hypothetical protein